MFVHIRKLFNVYTLFVLLHFLFTHISVDISEGSYTIPLSSLCASMEYVMVFVKFKAE